MRTEWRQKAEEILAVASTVKDRHAKSVMIAISSFYASLSKREKHSYFDSAHQSPTMGVFEPKALSALDAAYALAINALGSELKTEAERERLAAFLLRLGPPWECPEVLAAQALDTFRSGHPLVQSPISPTGSKSVEDRAAS